MKKSLLIIVVFGLLISCNLKNVSTIDKFIAVGYELNNAYILLYDQYTILKETLTDQKKQQFLSNNVAPVMNKLKRGLIVYNDALQVWRSTNIEPNNIGALQDEVKVLLGSASQLITELSLD